MSESDKFYEEIKTRVVKKGLILLSIFYALVITQVIYISIPLYISILIINRSLIELEYNF